MPSPITLTTVQIKSTTAERYKYPLFDTGFSIRIPEVSIVHLGDMANQGEIFMRGTRQVIVQAPWTIPGVEVVDTYPLQE